MTGMYWQRWNEEVYPVALRPLRATALRNAPLPLRAETERSSWRLPYRPVSSRQRLLST